MGTKWSQQRRKSSGSLSVKLWSKKKSPSTTEVNSSEVVARPCTTQRRSCTTQRRSCKPQHEFLTEEEQDALVSSWDAFKSGDLQLIGIRILIRIFELEPETKQTFPNFRNLSTVQLLENPKFKSHAIRFMRAVEVTMENLDALDVIIIPNLKHLGQLHTDISGFKLSYLEAVEEAMDETWSDLLNGKTIFVQGYKSNNNNDGDEDKISTGNLNSAPIGYDQLTRSAWMKVFRLITSKIMEGYHEGKEAKLTKEKSKVKSQEASTSSSKSSTPGEFCPMEHQSKDEGKSSGTNQTERLSHAEDHKGTSSEIETLAPLIHGKNSIHDGEPSKEFKGSLAENSHPSVNHFRDQPQSQQVDPHKVGNGDLQRSSHSINDNNSPLSE